MCVPHFITPKKYDFEGFLVTTYCSLHKATITNHSALPRIEDLLDHLQGDYSFTQMDLTTYYHKVHKNVVSHLGKCVVIYLDDILVFNNSWVENMQCVHNILELLWEHTSQVNKSSCGHTSIPHVRLILDIERI